MKENAIGSKLLGIVFYPFDMLFEFNSSEIEPLNIFAFGSWYLKLRGQNLLAIAKSPKAE